ncbi:uncharacterized protein [Dipodomys merriami]|uniref:uncharacterized protein isoform X1 n=1 Tax=Dipodomys merriami TaxID=94247 RepID=UPI003855EDB4
MRGTVLLAWLLCGSIFPLAIAQDNETAPSVEVTPGEHAIPTSEPASLHLKTQESTAPAPSSAAAGTPQTDSGADVRLRATVNATEHSVTPGPYPSGRKQLKHIFSEPEKLSGHATYLPAQHRPTLEFSYNSSSRRVVEENVFTMSDYEGTKLKEDTKLSKLEINM